MKRIALLIMLSFCLAAPSMMMAQGTYNHAEVGAFVDYLRFGATNPTSNLVGVGGRVGFNVHPNVMLEAEMTYDFERSFVNVNSNGTGGNGSIIRTSFRPLTGLFGPKFQVGGSGPFRAFVTGKVGFVNFNVSHASVGTGFNNAFNSIGNSATKFAAYPGAGIEGFWGPFGLRLDAGDEIYLNNGAYNNLKVTFGPVLRF
ncbi:MAG TPA: hypothetical protein VFA74_01685 [Terriglobales bacterium]|nr:hypothetical protein [Terriglobales bacterium]